MELLLRVWYPTAMLNRRIDQCLLQQRRVNGGGNMKQLEALLAHCTILAMMVAHCSLVHALVMLRTPITL